VFTRVRQMYLSWSIWDQSTSPQATAHIFRSVRKVAMCLSARMKRTGSRWMDFNETILGIFTQTFYKKVYVNLWYLAEKSKHTFHVDTYLPKIVLFTRWYKKFGTARQAKDVLT
jgi:hypothetical protein